MTIHKLIHRFERGWNRAASISRRLWHAVTSNDDPDAEPPNWLYPGVGLVLAAVILGVVFLLIVPAVRAVVSGIADWLADGAGWLRISEPARIVLDPVHAYLTEHNMVEPGLGDGTIWWSWAAFGAGSFALSFLFRNVGARIGWALWGAATVAMVWAEAPVDEGRPVAAGVAAAWWCAFTVVAYRRRWGHPRVVALLPQFRALSRWLDYRERMLEQRVAAGRRAQVNGAEPVPVND